MLVLGLFEQNSKVLSSSGTIRLAREHIIDELNSNGRRFDLGTTRVFYDYNNRIIGYLDYFIVGRCLFIKNILVTARRQGYGKEIIKFLFDNLEIENINGYFIDEISYRFWKSLNATFEKDDSEKFMLSRDNCSF